MSRTIKKRPHGLMTVLAMAPILLLAALVTTAAADVLHWQLSATLENYGTVTGTVLTNRSTGAIAGFNITVSGTSYGWGNYAPPEATGYADYGYLASYDPSITSLSFGTHTEFGVVNSPWYIDQELFLVFDGRPALPLGSLDPIPSTLNIVSPNVSSSFLIVREYEEDAAGNMIPSSEIIFLYLNVTWGELVYKQWMYPQDIGGDVPLPTSAFLLGSGLLGLAVARCKRRWRL